MVYPSRQAAHCVRAADGMDTVAALSPDPQRAMPAAIQNDFAGVGHSKIQRRVRNIKRCVAGTVEARCSSSPSSRSPLPRHGRTQRSARPPPPMDFAGHENTRRSHWCNRPLFLHGEHAVAAFAQGSHVGMSHGVAVRPRHCVVTARDGGRSTTCRTVSQVASSQAPAAARARRACRSLAPVMQCQVKPLCGTNIPRRWIFHRM